MAEKSNTTVKYGKIKCGTCGKETTLDKTVWHDALMCHRCDDCRKEDKR